MHVAFRGLVLVVSLLVAGAATAAGSPELPDTELGAIVREWLDVIERGDEAEILGFVAERFSANARRDQPDAAEIFLKLHAQSGGLDLLQVRPPAGEYPMMLLARSRKGPEVMRIQLALDRSEPGRLRGLGLSRFEDPEAPKLSERERPRSCTARIAAIRDELERRASDDAFSGVVLIASGDSVLLHEAYGMADADADRPVTRNTAFHLASVGKMFTAVAIAQLVEQGKLSWDDTVADVLPEFPNGDLAKRVTIRHLLTHSAGMGTFFWSPGYDPDRTWANAREEISVYQDEALMFEPGDRWFYSNAGYSLLGAIIEETTGRTYLETIREKILKPLRMRATDVNDPGEAAEKAAVLYRQSESDPLGLDPFEPDRKIRTSHATGFGDGSSTAADLFRFARAYRKDELPGGIAVASLFADAVPDGSSEGARYGYGVRERRVNGELVRGHSGGGRTDLQMLWDSDWTVIVQTNRTPPPATALSNEIIAYLTGAKSACE